MDSEEESQIAGELMEHALLAIRKPGLPYRQRRAISTALRSMPDAYSCPRAFRAWNQKPLREAIAASGMTF